MDLVSMGMFILDEIHWGAVTKTDIIGGGGIYTAVGAGLFLDPEARHRSGAIVDMGSDFPIEVKRQLENWGVGFVYRFTPERLTSRGWNNYLANDEREFKYTTPKKQITADDLLDNPPLSQAKCVHFICSPERLLEFVDKLDLSRDQIVMWEPVPTATSPRDWPKCQECFDKVDVLSPNSKEAAGFLGLPEPLTHNDVEIVADKYASFQGLLVIRCGALGSLVSKNGERSWHMPYHLAQSKVVDPTGGGNSFLGGLGIGLVHADLDTAIAYANVAAGLMIEQVGFPDYDPRSDLWNGDKISDRIAYYRDRESI